MTMRFDLPFTLLLAACLGCSETPPARQGCVLVGVEVLADLDAPSSLGFSADDALGALATPPIEASVEAFLDTAAPPPTRVLELAVSATGDAWVERRSELSNGCVGGPVMVIEADVAVASQDGFFTAAGPGTLEVASLQEIWIRGHLPAVAQVPEIPPDAACDSTCGRWYDQYGVWGRDPSALTDIGDGWGRTVEAYEPVAPLD
jgi:hypothetical protein